MGVTATPRLNLSHHSTPPGTHKERLGDTNPLARYCFQKRSSLYLHPWGTTLAFTSEIMPGWPQV